jgi:hypothetical protein
MGWSFRASETKEKGCFGRRKKGPGRPFTHADDCKILKADPDVSIQWSEVESGHWRAVCQCGAEDAWERDTGSHRARLNPCDATTARHLPQCQFAGVAAPPFALKVRDSASGDYWWVECSSCESGWQVPYYAPERVG